jgi:hypothetical protein
MRTLTNQSGDDEPAVDRIGDQRLVGGERGVHVGGRLAQVRGQLPLLGGIGLGDQRSLRASIVHRGGVDALDGGHAGHGVRGEVIGAVTDAADGATSCHT